MDGAESPLEEAQATQVAFMDALNEAMDKFRNPDGTMSMGKMCGVQTALVFAAGYMEGLINSNRRLLLGSDVPPLPSEKVMAVYEAGLDEGVSTFLNHGDDVGNLIKDRLSAMKMGLR